MSDLQTSPLTALDPQDMSLTSSPQEVSDLPEVPHPQEVSLASDDLQEKIPLLAADGQKILVTEEIIRKSVTLANMIDELGLDDLESAIPLYDVDFPTLAKIIEYCTHYKDVGPPANDEEKRARRTSKISDWDAKFINVEQEILFKILLASNYLDIKDLIDLCGKTIALQIKGKSPEQLCQQFGIKNDLTEKEKKQIREDYDRCLQRWGKPDY